ncbi:MAG: type II toxin-antitoxin system VapC family toxin [Acidobacteria bacterium]|nr:type II toxin-antitoxin system VapC family toxin [Acidobacteriota bacterium]
MSPSVLLDTHILIRWLSTPKLLTREQKRVLDQCIRRQEQVGISAITLLEFAMLAGDRKIRLNAPIDGFLDSLKSDPRIFMFAITYEIALESAYLGILRDPADRAIVATARVHGLRLLTSDQRILSTNFVSTIG